MVTTEQIVRRCRDAGAVAAGVVECAPVDEEDWRLFTEWRAEGKHAGMSYMEKYDEVRRDPRLLLEGVRTMIVCAFDYRHPSAGNRLIAEYARGRDYHITVRERLQPVCDWLEEGWGGATRICVDSAPLRERYWAVRAGLGWTGRNGQLVVPSIGSAVNLAAILWTGQPTSFVPQPSTFNPQPSSLNPQPSSFDFRPSTFDSLHSPLSTLHSPCDTCRKCVDACPGHALDGTGRVDARRCLSYLTIESKDPLPEGTRLCGQMFGCDICRLVCPYNIKVELLNAPAGDTPSVTDLTAEDWQKLPSNQLKRIIKGTPLTRVPISRLRYLASQINPK